MKMLLSDIAIVISMFLYACGGSSTHADAGLDASVQPCDPVLNPCSEGLRCDADAKCVQADPLQITSAELPDGRVGFAYEFKLEATGGLEPYSWFISSADQSLSFLSMQEDGTLKGTAPEQISDAQIAVGLTDSGLGQGLEVKRSYSISFAQCKDGDTELCYTPAGSTCKQGSKTCESGEMGQCVAGQHLSSDRNHCGSNCTPCQSDVADACLDGLCACGQNPVCKNGLKCCDGQCVDTLESVTNCGSCFHDCELAISHSSSSSKTCSSGQCDYSGDCDEGWLDCDGVRSNGCERPANRVDSCGSCETDCNSLVVHVPSSQKTCEQTQDGFICSYTSSCSQDFADCDSDRSNGCETWLTQQDSCGSCDTDCAQSQLGSECISPDQADPYYHVCGCKLDPSTGQSLGCSAADLCCHHVCTDATQDSQNCGVCEATCSAGTCAGSVCQCSIDDDCPQSSPATSCGSGGECLCSNFQDGSSACQLGQYCCDGQQGGSGGPDGDQDLGCCPKRCGWNDSENFPCTF